MLHLFDVEPNGLPTTDFGGYGSTELLSCRGFFGKFSEASEVRFESQRGSFSGGFSEGCDRIGYQRFLKVFRTYDLRCFWTVSSGKCGLGGVGVNDVRLDKALLPIGQWRAWHIAF